MFNRKVAEVVRVLRLLNLLATLGSLLLMLPSNDAVVAIEPRTVAGRRADHAATVRKVAQAEGALGEAVLGLDRRRERGSARVEERVDDGVEDEEEEDVELLEHDERGERVD